MRGENRFLVPILNVAKFQNKQQSPNKIQKLMKRVFFFMVSPLSQSLQSVIFHLYFMSGLKKKGDKSTR